MAPPGVILILLMATCTSSARLRAKRSEELPTETMYQVNKYSGIELKPLNNDFSEMEHGVPELSGEPPGEVLVPEGRQAGDTSGMSAFQAFISFLPAGAGLLSSILGLAGATSSSVQSPGNELDGILKFLNPKLQKTGLLLTTTSNKINTAINVGQLIKDFVRDLSELSKPERDEYARGFFKPIQTTENKLKAFLSSLPIIGSLFSPPDNSELSDVHLPKLPQTVGVESPGGKYEIPGTSYGVPDAPVPVPTAPAPPGVSETSPYPPEENQEEPESLPYPPEEPESLPYPPEEPESLPYPSEKPEVDIITSVSEALPYPPEEPSKVVLVIPNPHTSPYPPAEIYEPGQVTLRPIQEIFPYSSEEPQVVTVKPSPETFPYPPEEPAVAPVNPPETSYLTGGLPKPVYVPFKTNTESFPHSEGAQDNTLHPIPDTFHFLPSETLYVPFKVTEDKFPYPQNGPVYVHSQQLPLPPELLNEPLFSNFNPPSNPPAQNYYSPSYAYPPPSKYFDTVASEHDLSNAGPRWRSVYIPADRSKSLSVY